MSERYQRSAVRTSCCKEWNSMFVPLLATCIFIINQAKWKQMCIMLSDAS